MKITKRQLKRIIKEAVDQQPELELHPTETWEYMDEFIQTYPQLANTLTISQFKDLHRKAYGESLDIARDPRALAVLGFNAKPQNAKELNDLLFRLMARTTGVR